MIRSRRRGSAAPEPLIYGVAIALLCLLLHLDCGDAATFTVGDSDGWNFNANAWPNGKVFRAGDVLRFNYDPTVHNVVAVDKVGYSSCRTPVGARVFRSGKDEIRISKGQNFFLCNFPGHCESGMKIVITAI